MLLDGRILYDRREYVDRNFGDTQSLWTCNPDGTNHTVYYGNNTPSPGAVIDARPIPNSDKITCLFAACHDRPWGAMVILDRKLGIDGEKPVYRIWDANLRKLIGDINFPSFNPDILGISMPRKIASPYPLNAEKILYTQMIRLNNEKTGLYLGIVDHSGNLIYEDSVYGCFEPVPFVQRNRPPTIPFRRDFASQTGTFYVQDVYQGTHLTGIKRGDVKYIRVVETPEKRFWSGGALLSTVAPAVNWDELMNKRVLGVVPVNADGSAVFEIPAERFVYFQLLDKDGAMLQTMRSGTYVQPAEINACTGCHEDRLSAVTISATTTPFRSKQITKLTAPAKAYSYFDNVQPVWDKYCVSCHNADKPEGQKLNLNFCKMAFHSINQRS
jgi:hypothetical protein